MQWVILPLPRASQAGLGMEAGSLRWFKAQGQQGIAWSRSETWGKKESREFPRGRGGTGSCGAPGRWGVWKCRARAEAPRTVSRGAGRRKLGMWTLPVNVPQLGAGSAPSEDEDLAFLRGTWQGSTKGQVKGCHARALAVCQVAALEG